MTSYIRIYERECLDNFCPSSASELATSTLGFVVVDGHYVNNNRQVVDLSANETVFEVVKSGQLILGGGCTRELRAFAQTYVHSLEFKFASEQCKIEQVAAAGKEILPAKYQELLANSQQKAVVEREMLHAKRQEEAKQQGQAGGIW